jgi:hypothetical protein
VVHVFDLEQLRESKTLQGMPSPNGLCFDPDAVGNVLGAAARNTDRRLFDQLLREAGKAKDPADRQKLLVTLGSTVELHFAKQALEVLVAKEFSPQEACILLSTLAGHSETRAFTYDYPKQHYDAVAAALPGESVFWYLPMIFAGCSETEQDGDLAAFFKDKDVKLTGGPRVLAQVTELISANHALQSGAAEQPDRVSPISVG